MARRLLLKEDQLASTGDPPSGYQWIGYNGATFSERQSDGDIIKIGNPRPYKVYTALLTESGTDIISIILENTLGNYSFERVGPGFWEFAPINEFDFTKVWCYIDCTNGSNSGNQGDYTPRFLGYLNEDGTDQIVLYLPNGDGFLGWNTKIEIRVYN